VAKADSGGNENTSLRTRFAFPLGIAAFAVASAFWLDAIARHATNSNSDSATVVLEGQAMNAGHVLLSSWSLSLDSFWSVDVLFYAFAVRIYGVVANLMFTVPAVIAALVVFVGALMAIDNRRDRCAIGGLVAVAIPLAFPARAFAFFYVQGPFHVATTLWCLLGFALVAKNSFGARWFLGVVFLAAGILGDFQTVTLGLFPVLVVGVLVADASRRWRDAIPILSVAPAAAVLAYVVRTVAKHFGTYGLAPANHVASHHQQIANFEHLPSYLAGLSGIGHTFGLPGVPVAMQVMDVVRLAIILGGPLVVLCLLPKRVLARHRIGVGMTPGEILDCVLLVGFIADLVMFVLLPIISSPAYGRYLSPGIIFGSVLAGRVVTRFLAGRTRQLATVFVAAAVILAGVFAIGATEEVRGNGVVQPASSLAAFLKSQNLTSGVGDYWSASITTVESDGEVRIRPVINLDSTLVRYGKNSAAAWYVGVRFNFFVFEPSSIWNGDTERAAVREWGSPSRIWRIGPDKVVVFPKYFEVSAKGWTGP
jgi:hypothetical protein